MAIEGCRLHSFHPATGALSDWRFSRTGLRRLHPHSGKIVNIGSLPSELARATVTPYTVAKGGIRMLTRGMAAEWGEHNIQSNAIGPGYVLT